MNCKDCLGNYLGYCKLDCLCPEKCENFQARSLWVKLPCKVGDILYDPTDRDTISEYEVTAVRVELFSTFVEWGISEGIVHGINSNEIGKTVFLTREEAERALKDRSDE